MSELRRIIVEPRASVMQDKERNTAGQNSTDKRLDETVEADRSEELYEPCQRHADFIRFGFQERITSYLET